MTPELFNIVSNDLNARIESFLIKFADETKPGGLVNTWENRIRILKTLDKLEN